MREWYLRLFKAFSSRTLAAVTISCGLIGCSGHVYTVHNPVGNSSIKADDCSLTVTDTACKFEGVVAYHPANFIEISYTTSVLKTKTNPQPGGQSPKTEKTTEVERTYKGTGSQKCEPQMVVKQVIRGDYEHPYQLYYNPGFLEKYTFKSEFEQGVLKSLNTDSTPDRGETLKNIVTAAADAAKMVTTMSGEGEAVNHCTDEPLLMYIKRAEEVCPGGKCNYDNYPFKAPQ